MWPNIFTVPGIRSWKWILWVSHSACYSYLHKCWCFMSKQQSMQLFFNILWVTPLHSWWRSQFLISSWNLFLFLNDLLLLMVWSENFKKPSQYQYNFYWFHCCSILILFHRLLIFIWLSCIQIKMIKEGTVYICPNQEAV